MKKYILIISMLSLFSACQDPFDEPSTLSLLTDNDEKKWQVINIIDPSQFSSDPCNSDDIWTFSLFDETLGQPGYVVEDNYVSCGDEYILERGFWRLNNEGNRITLTSGDTESGDNINTVFSIISINDENLQLGIDVEGDNGFTLTNVVFKFRAI